MHFLCTYKNWTEAEPRPFLVRKGFYLNGGQLALSSSLPDSLSICVMEDKVPVCQSAMSEGVRGYVCVSVRVCVCGFGAVSLYTHTHIYSNVLHSVPCDVEI